MEKTNVLKSSFEENGFISPVNIITKQQAKQHRIKLENAEDLLGSLHYKSKVHTVIKSAYELATNKNCSM